MIFSNISIEIATIFYSYLNYCSPSRQFCTDLNMNNLQNHICVIEGYSVWKKISLNNTIITLVLYAHVIRRLSYWWNYTVMCITRGFMVGLGNNGVTNPIISSCLEISIAHTIRFPLDFPFPFAIHRRNVCRVNGLHY